MSKLISWLAEKPVGGVSITVDRYILAIYKLCYLFIRIFLGLILGREQRNRSSNFKKFVPSPLYFSASFSFLILLKRILELIGINNMNATKIYVPKYGYRVYCPLTLNDFINMTTREDDILQHYTVKEGDVVIDIGAHIGRYTLISSNIVGHDGKIVAIEADPYVFEKLNQNLNLNHISNTITINSAVFSSKGKLKLFIPENKISDTIYNTLYPSRAPARNCNKYLEIESNTLDDLLQTRGIEFECINWIKIDVEGAEYEVLKGAHNILSKSKNLSVLIEVHNIEGKNQYQQIVDLLEKYNFKINFKKVHESGEMHIVFKKNLELKNKITILNLCLPYF